ncbi:MAG: hypothetical protein IJX15_00150, partial [Ruminiclostridium sp.]|nr:hypothetical protein [Ruminiclostridium sp.]
MGKKRSKKKQNRVVTERLVEQVNQEADELDDKKDEASEVFSETISEVLNEDYKEVESVIEQDENISETEEVVVEEKIDRPNKFYLVFAVFVIVMSIIVIISTAR